MNQKINGTTKKTAKEMSHEEVHSRIRETPIAIVGMASLMPDAKSLDLYWSNIVEKVNSIVDVPPNRWSIDDYYDPDPSVPDKTYCKRGAFLPEIDFNPMEFGLPPNILEVTDAGQLLSLVVAKDVLEDAGIFEDSTYDRDRIGCVLGIGGGQKLSASLTARLQYPVLERILRSSGVGEDEIKVIIEKYKANYVPWEENSFPGLLGNVIAGRIANRFNLGGMNSVVDAACASSLSAIKVSVNELLAGDSDMMITGGACADNSVFMYMSFSKTPAFTTDDYIKPFDEESKGMMIGEGIGMIAIKRLEDAETDGDRIYSVIKGVGSSSDGKFKSIYAPRPQGQSKALRRAYADAGFAPSTVGLIEAHGTGTAAGDAAEFEGLREVFADRNDCTQHIALGSVKSQIGHLKAAAGAAGIIKCALALHHKVLPATLSVSKPNPKLDVENSPFYINTEVRPWVAPADGSPRRTGTSSFGFGGTNFHVVMEEYSPRQTGAYRLNPVAQPSLVSAPNLTQLRSALNEALAGLRDEKDLERYKSFLKESELREIPANHPRIGFVSLNIEEGIEQIERSIEGLENNSGKGFWELPQGICFRSTALECEGGVVALFSGQGSQYVGMGNELANNFPTYLESVESMDRHYVDDDLPRLSETVFPIPVFDEEAKSANDKTLQQTPFAQPGIGTFSAGTYKIFTEAGFKADFVAGHSFGELTALWAAGVYDEDDFYALAKARGQAMSAPDDKDFDAGTMAAVIGDVANLSEDLGDFPEVVIANYNSKSQVVIAGPKVAIEKASVYLKEKGYKAIALPVSAAFHTTLVRHAQAPFAEAIDGVKFKKPTIPVFSNSSGEVYPTATKSIRKILKEHILNSVRFTDELENIHAAGGRIFVEFGPKKVLAPMVENVLEGKEHLTVSINPNPKKSSDLQLRLAATQLAVAGVSLSNLDPFAAEKPVYNTTKPSPLNIKMSAPNYLSEGFVKKRDAILEDGFKLSTATPQVVEKEIFVQQPGGSDTSTPVQAQGSAESLEQGLALFYKHERETLKIHEQYLETPKQYTDAFQALMQQQLSVTKANPGATMAEGVERSLIKFHENQSQTLQIHEKFLDQQAETSRDTLNLMKEHYSLLTGAPTAAKTTVVPRPQVAVTPTLAPVLSVSTPTPAAPKIEVVQPAAVAPIAASASGAVDLGKLTDTMLSVVAEKTGYPTEMLEMDMDMEADLGIDSIKRVEILGAVQEEFPGLPELDAEVMSGLRTLGEIVDYMKSQVPTASVSTVQEPAASSAGASEGVDVTKLTDTMLSVVAEKTGYPAEMLELGMDMEADLGIDSIKRVEILGAVQEEFPGLPELDAEVMYGLRTLGEIVVYMKSRATSVDAQTTPAEEPKTVEPAAPVVTASATLNIDAVTDVMLKVVAEKTGYPADMLELGMDMEADLGIDSIKRVEILGAVQEECPELPEVDPEVLASMKTLEEIIGCFLSTSESAEAPVPVAPASLIAEVDSLDAPSEVSRSVARLKCIPTPDQLAQSIPEGRSCVITDDGMALTSKLSASLAEQGWKVGVLSFPKSVSTKRADLGDSVQRFELTDVDEGTLVDALKKIESELGAPAQFIHLDPAGTEVDSRAILQTVFLAAKHLRDALNDAPADARCSFVTVAHLDGQLGHGGGPFRTIPGGLFGLTKTVNLEWSDVFCRAIDFDASMDAEEAAISILAECADPNRSIVEVGYSKLGRVTLVPRFEVDTDSSAVAGNGKSTIGKDDVFLVSGGAKGVTAECVVKLATVTGTNFILLGRSEIAEIPAWADGVFGEADLIQAGMKHLKSTGEKPTPMKVKSLIRPVESTRAIEDVLQRVEDVGGQARYISCDVSDAAMMKTKIDGITRDFGAVTGIIHGAGVLADKLIEDKTLEDFRSVYSPKVDGLDAMLRCVEPEQLKHLSLFSSAAGFFGNPAQSDYSIANEILNKAALSFKGEHPECHVTSFNWGPWDGGMVTPELKKLFAERNIDVIPIELGTDLFVHDLSDKANSARQILVGSSMEFDGDSLNGVLNRYSITRNLMVSDNPFLGDHVIDGKPVLPMAGVMNWMASSCEGLHPGYRFFSLDDMKMLKGIVFQNGNLEQIRLEVNEVEKSDGAIKLDVTMWSGNNETRINHYSGTVTLVNGAPATLVYEGFNTDEANAVDGSEFYENGTLFHGPMFQVIDRALNSSEGRLTLECTTRNLSAEDQGQFPVDAQDLYAIDAKFQALLIWTRQFKEAGALPTSFSRCEQYRAITPGERFYLSLEIESATNSRVNGTITIHDAHGEVFSRIIGAETTISKSLTFVSATN